MTFGANPAHIGLIFGGLFIFGLAYNTLVAELQSAGYDEGYTAILVAIGVLATLFGVALVDLDAALLALAAFIASGVPMIVGSWWRYARRRQTAINEIRNGAADDQK